jgi:hypothetical protein
LPAGDHEKGGEPGWGSVNIDRHGYP